MTSRPAARLALLYAAVPCSVVAQARDDTQKLEGFKDTRASLNIETVPQGGTCAAALKANLEQVKLPPGFKIGLYAVAPDARHMAVGPSTGMVFVSMRKTYVWAVPGRTKSHVADEVKVFAPSVSFKVPDGLCFSPDSVLYVAEQNRVLASPIVDFFYENLDVATASIVSQGELIPAEEESFNHTAQTCRVGPDDKLYIILGNPFSVSLKEKVALYDKVEMMGTIRTDRDGKHHGVSARSVCNSVGMGFNPKDKTLRFTDNQVDGMGDGIPPGELDHTTKAGENLGLPWYDGGHIRTVEYKSETPPSGAVSPQVEMAAHVADLGMTLYKGKMFPTRYQGGVFGAQRGS